ncbi:MAG: gamma-glutamyl-gamma-aminobutyrate hydrolase family protein [Blastocatellia bacterium]|nr:gamma-glutamyl-gamma-aminobutyrate hydrolase family protein [Blastocatellia bacterium]
MERTQNQIDKNLCIFEPITPQIEKMRVITVDNLIEEESHFSQVARNEADFNAERWLRYERKIASLAMANIESNIRNLVKLPVIRPVHLSELDSDLVADFDPDAIVLSGTLRDFDFYDERLIAGFDRFIKSNRTPVLAICGGHQLVGQSFGSVVVTLDYKLPSERRYDRPVEYQYKYVKITDSSDPIFAGIDEHLERRWQNYTKRKHLLRVWQNHGLQLDRLPDGFEQLARGYLSEIQMMVRRTSEQLIYGVQFHIEKSFQDWQHDRYWDHRDESRDGRLIFENFLIEALRFRGESEGVLAAAN